MSNGVAGTSLGIGVATQTESGSDKENKLRIVFITIFVFGATVTLLIVVSIMLYHRHRRCNNRRVFEQALAQAQQHVLDTPLLRSEYLHTPVGGEYRAMTYNPKCRQQCTWTATLQFRRIAESKKKNFSISSSDTEMASDESASTPGHYWTISGKGRNVHGYFNILHGRLAPNGEAYWVEQQSKKSGTIIGAGRLVLVHGSFEWERRQMYGAQWRCDTGLSDRFIDLKVVSTMKNGRAVSECDYSIATKVSESK